MRLGRTARVLKDGAMALCSPALSKMAGPAAIAPEVLGFVDVQQLQETWPWQVHVGRRLHVRGIGLDCCRLSQVCLGMLRQIPGKFPQQRHARGRLDVSSGAVAIGKACLQSN